jgi:hypothetical protein
MMTQERQKYDREFKQKAVELSFTRGNAREIAEELGIRRSLAFHGGWDKGSTPLNYLFNKAFQSDFGFSI